jgi:NADH-quinone oxidoreductase subunit C
VADGTDQKDPTDEAASDAQPEDSVRAPLLEVLRAELAGDLVEAELAHGDLWVRVQRSAWRRAAEVCKDRLGMTYFCFLSGLDWKPNPDLLGEKAWDEVKADATAAATGGPATGGGYPTGVAGGETRFQVFARLYNVDQRVGITLKADLPEDDPRIESWVPVFRGADWHEREAWEMYGFLFDGHPGLRHLYLPSEFEGHPLRKDFPLIARLVKPWPGLVDVEPMPGDDEAESSDVAEET